jgi:hypothetical protein
MKPLFRVSKPTSFEKLTEEELETHLAIRRYGNFLLPEAITPSYDLEVVPTSGFKFEQYEDSQFGKIPVLIVSATKEVLFPLYMDLISLFEGMVGVVLETSHSPEAHLANRCHHIDLHQEGMDSVVIQSILWDFEKLLVDDGCTGIAIYSPETELEVQFDEHKVIFIYNWPRFCQQIMAILEKYGILQKNDLELLQNAEHIHSTSTSFEERFEILKNTIGAQ